MWLRSRACARHERRISACRNAGCRAKSPQLPSQVLFHLQSLPHLLYLPRAIGGGSQPTLSRYVVVLTANAMASDKQKCLESGMEFFLPKPGTLDPLMQALRTGFVTMCMKRKQADAGQAAARGWKPNARQQSAEGGGGGEARAGDATARTASQRLAVLVAVAARLQGGRLVLSCDRIVAFARCMKQSIEACV